jgi:hypothetical protein
MRVFAGVNSSPRACSSQRRRSSRVVSGRYNHVGPVPHYSEAACAAQSTARLTGKPAWPSGKRTFWFAMNLRWSFWRAERMAVGGASDGVALIVLRRAGAGPGLRGRPRDRVAPVLFSKIACALSLQSSLSTCNVRRNRSIRRATFERATRFNVQSSHCPWLAVAQLSGTGRPRHSS